MNYCTKCESFYQKPGTCNCYAQASPPLPISPWVQPTYPGSIPWYPTYPSPTITWGNLRIVTSGCTTLSGDDLKRIQGSYTS